MNKLISLVTIIITIVTQAGVTPPSGFVTIPSSTVPLKAMEVLARKSGGMLIAPGSQQGEIVYVNCQKRIPDSWIKESIAYFKDITHFNISYTEGTFNLSAPQIKGNATLYVIDDEKLPSILVAPENRWAFVNIAPIAQEKRPAYFEARSKKELTRGFAYLCGATNSQYPRALTRGIVDHAELDKNPDHTLPVDVIQRFQPYMDTLGVKPARVVTYRIACREGWAPMPTNEVQRAIWEKVREAPKNPMKIEYDPKKGR